jgi:hypothetical protein
VNRLRVALLMIKGCNRNRYHRRARIGAAPRPRKHFAPRLSSCRALVKAHLAGDRVHAIAPAPLSVPPPNAVTDTVCTCSQRSWRQQDARRGPGGCAQALTMSDVLCERDVRETW